VTYAALILHDDGLPISAENITKLIKAANAEVQPYWPKLFAQLLQGKDVNALLMAVGGGGGGGHAEAAPAAAAPAAGGKEEKKDAGKGGKKEETKKEAPKEEPAEEEADMGFSLFD